MRVFPERSIHPICFSMKSAQVQWISTSVAKDQRLLRNWGAHQVIEASSGPLGKQRLLQRPASLGEQHAPCSSIVPHKES